MKDIGHNDNYCGLDQYRQVEIQIQTEILIEVS